MAIVKKPSFDAKEVDNIIDKGGSTSSEKAKGDEKSITVGVPLSPKLNATVISLLKDKFGVKRTKKGWVLEAIFEKIKRDTGTAYRES